MKNKRVGRTIFSLVMLAILLLLVFIMDSGILKTDKEYWIVFIIMMTICVVGLTVVIIMARKNVLEAEEKRIKKMIDKNNKDKVDDEK